MPKPPHAVRSRDVAAAVLIALALVSGACLPGGREDALESPTPPFSPATAVANPRLTGCWARELTVDDHQGAGTAQLCVQGGELVVRMPDQTVVGQTFVAAGDRITFTGWSAASAARFCEPFSSASYLYGLSAGALTLSPIADSACPQRLAVLSGTWSSAG